MAESSSENSQSPSKGRPNGLSRSHFLKSALIVSTGAVAASCAPSNPSNSPNPLPTPVHPLNEKYPEVPPAPTAAPGANNLIFFTPAEAHTVDAISARLIPGTPDDPGAHEAGVVTFIDYLLSFNQGYAESTYTKPPSAKAYVGTPPPEAATANPQEVVYVEKKELVRYGYQSSLTPQQEYRMGLGAVDKYAQAKFGAKFVELSEQNQDSILLDMQQDQATGFDKPTATGFFKTLLKHTTQGFFADPAYGGNRNMVGWKLIGYPGAQRAYTAQDLKNEGIQLQPQSLTQLPPFHPGVHSEQGGVSPVSSGDLFPPSDARQNALQQFLLFCRLTH
jgi:gluconate 2-dehydrogenase gamma chain